MPLRKQIATLPIIALALVAPLRVCMAQATLEDCMRWTVESHESLTQKFKAGDTNLPLLKISSVHGYLVGCSVDKSNRVSYGSYHPGFHNSTHWGEEPLSENNRRLMNECLNRLPASTNAAIPLMKQFHISGVRSNQWFHVVYRTDNLPPQVDKLHQVINAPFKDRPAIHGKPSAPRHYGKSVAPIR